MTLYIAPIVEGHTEYDCIDRLLSRVWRELLSSSDRLQILRPSRENRYKLTHPTGVDLKGKVEEAYAKLGQRLARDSNGRGLLLLLLDAETECPAQVAPRLLVTARATRSDADIACVLPKRMLENWIVAGASTLAGINGLPNLLPLRDRFEEINGGAWLKAQIRSQNRARSYKKTVDAAAFVGAMNLSECRRNSPSFDKLCRELEARRPPAIAERDVPGMPERESEPNADGLRNTVQ